MELCSYLSVSLNWLSHYVLNPSLASETLFPLFILIVIHITAVLWKPTLFRSGSSELTDIPTRGTSAQCFLNLAKKTKLLASGCSAAEDRADYLDSLAERANDRSTARESPWASVNLRRTLRTWARDCGLTDRKIAKLPGYELFVKTISQKKYAEYSHNFDFLNE